MALDQLKAFLRKMQQEESLKQQVLAASTAEVKFPLRAGQVSLSPPCPPRNTSK